MIRIGPAGNSESFTAMGYKSTPQIPEYLEKMGPECLRIPVRPRGAYQS